MAEPATSDSSPDTDREFEPSAEMLVHDYDDEHTLDEEEALSGESCSNELDDLEKEGDMPIEDLLAMYGYDSGGPPPVPAERHDTRSSSEEEILSNQDLTLDKDEIARDLLKDDDDNNKETTVNDLLVCVKELPSQTSRLLRSANSQNGSSDEDDSEDEDYHPIKDEDWKKMISVGSDFQAAVPDGMCKYGDAPAYENEDRLLWDPNKMNDTSVETYLDDVHKQNQQCLQGVQAIPTSSHTRDDEQALYLLLQCGHNVEEALRRRKMQAVPPTDPMSLWSEEECRNFENGLRSYGKDFYLIQQNKVRTRSVGELVQFYYLWKKTERHDVFANKTRLEKKKYALHPGVTDYMDRFLDEQENPAPVRERSASPNITSLIYGDPKRHLELEAALEMVQKVVGSSSTVFSPLKLHPDLQPASTAESGPPPAAATTTVSISPELRGGQQSTENLVHIANFTSSLPDTATSDDITNGLVEPSPKRMRLEETSEQMEQTVEPAVVPAVVPAPSAVGRAVTTTAVVMEGAGNSDSERRGAATSSSSSSSLPPATTKAVMNTVLAENGSGHMNNVEVSISSVANSVHGLVEGALTACPMPSESPLPTTRQTEPVAQ